jgi:hypothetical protein
LELKDGSGSREGWKWKSFFLGLPGARDGKYNPKKKIATDSLTEGRAQKTKNPTKPGLKFICT